MPPLASRLGAILLLFPLVQGCFQEQPSRGGGQTKLDALRPLNPADVALPAGYRIEAVATGLTFPTGVTFDDQDRPYVVESGYSYGEAFTTPRLIRVEPDGRLTQVASGDNGPWTGVQFHDGAFYVAQGGVDKGGAIVRITPDGTTMALVDRLPSLGDHHTNGPAIHDRWIYFGIGTATNSGVVGEDNARFGWLKRHPEFHDIPGKDVKLIGENYKTNDGKTTGAYSPYGTPTETGQVIEGQVPCTGAILRVPLSGGTSELVAWGFRNPFGLAFAPDGKLYVTENGFDVRGSRPVWGTGDLLWRVEPGLWYGWPDYFAGEPINQEERFKPPDKPTPELLLAETPNPPPKPVARLPVHASADGLDFSRSDVFGHVGQAFIAEFGDMAPTVGKVLGPVGFNVVRVDVTTGVIEPFAVNRGKNNGPASLLKTGGLERPVAARFDRTGNALYLVDFGVVTMTKDGPQPREKTGVL